MKPAYRVEPFLNRIDSKKTLNETSIDETVNVIDVIEAEESSQHPMPPP